MIKRLTVALLCVFLLVGSVTLSGCAGRAPELEDVYDRLVYVLEESLVVNTAIFGEGVPVYEQDSELVELSHMYYGFNQNGMEYVMPYARYANTDEIKLAMKRVYSEDYCASLDQTLFTGYADGDLTGVVMPARYTEDTYAFYQSDSAQALTQGMRMYDYASMTIMGGSNARCLNVSIRSYSDSQPDQWEERQLVFVYENENWYLDVPSC